MFEACSADPRWPYPFRAVRFEDRDQRLTTLRGLDMSGRLAPPVRHAAKKPQWRTAGAPGPGSFGCRALGVRRCTPARPPPPVPASVTFGRDFPWMRQGNFSIILLTAAVKDYIEISGAWGA